MAELSPVLTVAREILRSAGLKGMHVDDIAAQAVQTNQNMQMSAEAFSRKLQGALAANLKLKTTKPTFAKVEGAKKGQFKKGWYRLKIERTPTVAATIEAPETEKAFLGKAGEYAVMGELLFWGYNASVMAVDSGIDVVASKDNRYFHIQVKTSSEQLGDRFNFTIRNSSFQQNDGAAMFYVFVLRRKITNEYIIIPSNYLRALIAAGKITSGTTLAITVTVDPKRQKYSLNGADINVFVGNFGVIK